MSYVSAASTTTVPNQGMMNGGNNSDSNSNSSSSSMPSGGMAVMWGIVSIVWLALFVIAVLDVFRTPSLTPAYQTLWVLFILFFPGIGLISWLIYRTLLHKRMEQTGVVVGTAYTNAKPVYMMQQQQDQDSLM